jgi:hypothetical protein
VEISDGGIISVITSSVLQWSINLFTNPDPVYSHTFYVTISSEIGPVAGSSGHGNVPSVCTKTVEFPRHEWLLST